jgi:hypothetical protein
MKRGRSVGGGGILMQRYNTREVVCHLLSFSIRKNRKNRHLTQRNSVRYKCRKFFQKFPLLSNGMPTWAVRTHDLWSVTRDTWQRKSKNRILSKNQGYRCYIIRSNYKYKSYSIYILYIQIYTYKHLPPYSFQNRRDVSRVTLTKLCANQYIPLNINGKNA